MKKGKKREVEGLDCMTGRPCQGHWNEIKADRGAYWEHMEVLYSMGGTQGTNEGGVWKVK